MGKKVIAAGHICLDITPVFSKAGKKTMSSILQPGKLIQMKGVDVHTGGSVANTGLAMKILGADVTLMGKIGKDAFGDMIHNILKEYKAEKGMLVMEGESTSYSVILAVPGIDRIFLHNPGANDTFQADDVPQKELENASLFHFGYPPLMKKMYEHHGEELQKLMIKVKDTGAATSLDMAAVDSAADVGHIDWKQILEKVIPYVDFFMPSAEELCYMLDKERFADWQKRAGSQDITEILDIEKDIKPLAKQCMDFGAKVLLIKCGTPGIYYRTAGRNTLMKVGKKAELNINRWADKEGFEKSYIPERVLSGTGAGDTSIAAFLTAMLGGYTIEECMQLSTATGASCVTEYDALSGLKSFSELQKKK
ncbi:carbohydrate kinase family protein [Waltera sp.]|uniref:carbohydrate kinase family protein n=1 Tax=Waltera sp. TaxID=2815806 RepID=UPI0039A391B2